MATLLNQTDFNLVSSYLEESLNTSNQEPLSIPCTLNVPLGLGLSGSVQLTPCSACSSPGELKFNMPTGYKDLDRREEDALSLRDEDLLSEEGMAFLPQVPQLHTNATLTNLGALRT